MKKDVALWKYNENGGLMHLRFRTYVASACIVFASCFVMTAIAWFTSTDSFTLGNILQMLAEDLEFAARTVSRFVVILYILMTILEFTMKAEGDPFQKRLYTAIRKIGRKIRRKRIYKYAAKHIPDIPKGTRRHTKNVTRAAFPAVVLVCEKIDMTNGSFKRIPMVLDAHTMLWRRMIRFEPCHISKIFEPEYIFRGLPAWKILDMFNGYSVSNEDIRMLRNCDRLTALEFRVVVDETALRGNNSNDDLLRLQIHKIPCVVSHKGKIQIADFEAFKTADALTNEFDILQSISNRR